jgi:hypothetical protein
VVTRRLLVPSSALLWGLQLAFLSPALALILTNLYGATTAEVGWLLAVYNTSGFITSLLVPAWADRQHVYLAVMMVCAGVTLLLAGLLAVATTLPVATVALVVVGGPAGVGSSMLGRRSAAGHVHHRLVLERGRTVVADGGERVSADRVRFTDRHRDFCAQHKTKGGRVRCRASTRSTNQRLGRPLSDRLTNGQGLP